MATATRNGSEGACAIDAILTPAPDDEEDQVQWIHPSRIIPWPGLNPRHYFNPAKHAELVASVRAKGILQPILLAVPTGPSDKEFWLVLGERRWRAAAEADRLIPAFVRTMTFEEALEVAVIENLQRDDISPIEEGFGFKQLIDLGVGQDAIAEKVGKSQEYISNRVRLTRLPENVAEMVAAGRLLASHARDYFLPFIDIPAKKRKELYERAIHDLDRTHHRKDNEPYRGEEVYDAICRIARDISKPTSGSDRWTVVFDPKQHTAECKCNGPKFNFYGGAAVRCFDDVWWNGAQDAARRERKKKQAAKHAKAEKVAEKTGNAPVFNDAPRGYSADQKIRTDDFIDVSLLEGANFVVVNEHAGKAVYCTDLKKIEAARHAAEAEADEIREDLVAERKRADIAAAKKQKITADILREALALIVSDDYETRDVLPEFFAEFGIKLTYNDREKGIRKLGNAQAEQVFKILVTRFKRGDFKDLFDNMAGNISPAEKLVRDALRKKYGTEVTRLRRKILASSGSKKSKKKLAKAGK